MCCQTCSKLRDSPPTKERSPCTYKTMCDLQVFILLLLLTLMFVKWNRFKNRLIVSMFEIAHCNPGVVFLITVRKNNHNFVTNRQTYSIPNGCFVLFQAKERGRE